MPRGMYHAVALAVPASEDPVNTILAFLGIPRDAAISLILALAVFVAFVHYLARKAEP